MPPKMTSFIINFPIKRQIHMCAKSNKCMLVSNYCNSHYHYNIYNILGFHLPLKLEVAQKKGSQRKEIYQIFPPNW